MVATARFAPRHHDAVDVAFTVDLTAPLDLAESLEPYRRNGDDLLDRWNGERLVRTSAVGGRGVAWRAGPRGDCHAPSLAVAADADLDPAGVTVLRTAIEATFIAAPPAWPDLLSRDPVL